MSAASRMALTIVMFALCSAAENGTVPKPKPDQYPARAETGGLTVAAEYMLHTIASGPRSFVVDDYLVIEVAVYPGAGVRRTISSGLFTLRMNGKKDELFPQTPGMVAASLKYSDWESQRRFEVAAGPVILGRPRPAERFPGDRRSEPTVPQPRVETRETTDYGSRNLSAPEAVTAWALPEGETAGPVSGFLYFAFKRKPKSIRMLELIFHDGEQRVPVKLF